MIQFSGLWVKRPVSLTIQTTKGQPKEKWQKNPFGWRCQEVLCLFGLICQAAFCLFWIEMSRSLLSFWIEMLNADAGFLFPLARRLPTPCSSNKRPDNLFLHSLVYWSSLGRPRHLNKSTNTKIQEKHSPVKWSYSFLPIRPRHLQRQSTQKRRKLTKIYFNI